MKLIGITGGIGTGKSTVANMLRERGWPVLSSDETSRTLLDTNAQVQERVITALGKDIVDANGTISRAKVAEKVFGHTNEHQKALHALNAIIHPLVMEEHWALIEEHRARQSPLLAIETALLYEIDLEDAFDYVIVVDAPEDVCIARVQERSGLSAEQVRMRIAEQMSMEEKKGAADFVIDNSKDVETLQTATSLIASIIELLPDTDAEG